MLLPITIQEENAGDFQNLVAFPQL